RRITVPVLPKYPVSRRRAPMLAPPPTCRQLPRRAVHCRATTAERQQVSTIGSAGAAVGSNLDWSTTPRRPTMRARSSADLRRLFTHYMRHAFASRLTMVGVDLRNLQELRGPAWAGVSRV